MESKFPAELVHFENSRSQTLLIQRTKRIFAGIYKIL